MRELKNLKENKDNLNSLSLNRRSLVLLGFVSAILTLTACGPTSFSPAEVTANIAAPGFYTIPPKVDIFISGDNTGSMYESYPSINTAIQNLASSLNSQNWDSRITVGLLVTPHVIDQVIGSQYDSNQGSAWVKPYPAAQAGGSANLLPSVFRLTTTFTEYLALSDISNVDGSLEPGLETISANLSQPTATKNFLRKDSRHVTIFIGNGDDTSKVNYCNDTEWNRVVPCEDIGNALCTPTATDPTGGSTTCGSYQSSLKYYQNWFNSAGQNQTVYAAVAAEASSNCLGAVSRVGTRYQSLAAATGGASFDICTTPLTDIVTSIGNTLTSERNSYQSKYLFIANAPDVSSVKITLYKGGDTSSPQVIPYDATGVAGWMYAGYVTNVPTVVSPIQMGNASGYAFVLPQAWWIAGNDQVSITYTVEGSKTVLSQ